MNFKSFGAGVALAGAVATVALATAPAQAAIIAGSNLGIGSAAQLINTGGTNFLLQFIPQFPNGNFGIVGSSSTGTFNSLGGAGTIQNIPLTQTSSTTWVNASSIVPLVSFKPVGGTPVPPAIQAITFDANNFVLQAFGGGSVYRLTFGGFFRDSSDGTSIAGNGIFSGTNVITNQGGGAFGGDITAIPTPALLPGLVGMGIAAWRKRKQANAEEAEAKV